MQLSRLAPAATSVPPGQIRPCACFDSTNIPKLQGQIQPRGYEIKTDRLEINAKAMIDKIF